MKKRLTAIFLSLCMCLSLCTSTFAASSSTQSQIEAEIQSEKNRVFSEVYRQLEAQNALSHMAIYEEILGPEIEMSVMAKHGISLCDANYYAPYGGVVTYTKSDCDVAITYLDYDNSYYYVLDHYSFKVSSIIQALMGYIPGVGGIFSGIFSLQSIVDSTACTSIKNCQGYAQIMNVYNRNDSSTSSFVSGWRNHSTMIIPSGATNSYANLFPQHNPFE